MNTFDQLYFRPVRPFRVWWLEKSVYAILTIDAITRLPRAERYDAAQFNAAHHPLLDHLPEPSARSYSAALILIALLAACALVRKTGGVHRAAIALLHTYVFAVSVLDNYQHHYFLTLLLWFFVFLPRSFWLIAASAGIMYTFAAIAKLEPVWLSGELLKFLARGARWVPPRQDVLYAAAAGAVIVLELILGLVYVGLGILERSPLKRGLPLLAVTAVLFHASASYVLRLQIGWFTELMIALTISYLFPAKGLARASSTVRHAIKTASLSVRSSLAGALRGARPEHRLANSVRALVRTNDDSADDRRDHQHR